MISEIAGTRLRLSEQKWPFAEENRQKIQNHWAQITQKNPALWDGKLILCNMPEIDANMLTASAFEISYSSYIAWRDWGFPDRSVVNIFGSALIQSVEGYLIFGVMGPQTAGAGLVYPPAGALERTDAGPMGVLDPVSSALRELEEETGLVAPHNGVTGGDFISWSGQLISICRVVSFERPAVDLVADIRVFLARQENAELANVVILKSALDLSPAHTVPYAQGIAQYLLDRKRKT